MDTCIFCKIASKEKAEKIVFEDDTFVVFPDHSPRTSTHLLITPKHHYHDFSEMTQQDPNMIKRIGEVIEQLLDRLDLRGKPFTWGFHAGGKQSINHIHAQFLSGMGADELVL